MAAFGEGGGNGVGAGAGDPAAAVDTALEAGAGLAGAKAEAGGRVPGRAGRVGVDRRVGSSQVDGPGVTRRRAVRVASRIRRAHVEGVAAFGEGGRDGVGAGARGPAAVVDAALEAGAGLAGAEAEAGGALPDGFEGLASMVVSGAVRSMA